MKLLKQSVREMDNGLKHKKIFFVGAGGIGMAALERWCMSRGLKVAGYDRTPSQLTDDLQREGVEITFDDSESAIPEAFRNPSETLVVYTPAVPADTPLFKWFRDKGFEMVKRSRLLGEVTRASKSLCFAGTHGKTTTSSMAAHLLHESGVGSNAFLGGVLTNYGTNFLLSETSPYSVVEADEFDRSFLQLRPTVAVVTATDPDHLDIYGDEAGYLEGFAQFTELIYPGGALIAKKGIKLQPRVQQNVRLYTYSRDEGDFHAENIRHADARIIFDFVGPDGLRVNDIELGVPVDINIENAVASLAAVAVAGELEPESARRAMASFRGAHRRFEFHLHRPDRAVIDDYAHHPDEVAASIASVRALYPGQELTVAFQPHLYTRTRDFAPQFAKALSGADNVILLDIYPAREEPIPGVTSRIILDALAPSVKERRIINKEQFPALMAEMRPRVLLSLGAGDISNYVPEIAKILSDEG